MARARTILVAGAGIGGLAAAIALAKSGFRALVFERADKLEEIGAGIQLTPNATRALDRLGILAAVRKRAVEAEALSVGCGETGRELARTALGKATVRRFGAPWLLTLRADLQRALHAAASDSVDVVLKTGAEVTDIAGHPRGVTVLARSAGKAVEHLGIALIGADGLHSKVRERLHGEEELEFCGHVAWRTLVPAAALPAPFAEPVVRLWLGREAHVVHYPVARGEAVNVVAVFRDAWRGKGWNEQADPASIASVCDRWATMPQRAVAAAREFRRWALADRAPLARWGEGLMTLLGDAAHPMLPFLAQGAAAAIEDAVALGEHLKRPGEVEAGLRAYEEKRIPRTARLQRAARRAGSVYHAGGLMRLARNIVLRHGDLIERHAWIYRYGAK